MRLMLKLLRYFNRELKIIGIIGSIRLLLSRLISLLFIFKKKNIYYSVNNKIFESLRIDRKKTEIIYKKLSEQLDIDNWKHSTNLNNTNDGSIHHLIFCGLKSLDFKPTNILEIGTYTAESTEFLSNLFPESSIYSVDLPENDPIYKKYFDVKIQDYLNERLEKIKKLNNVKLIEVNTAFLMEQNLPKMDLIWNDGDMFYPDIAWENSYLYSLLEDGGYLLNDDVHLEENKITLYNKKYLNIIETQRYIEKRIKSNFSYFYKNENYYQNAFYSKRISILKK